MHGSYHFSLSNELHNIVCLRHSVKHISCIIVATTFCIHCDYRISHKHIQPKTHQLISVTTFIRQIESNKSLISELLLLLLLFIYFIYLFICSKEHTKNHPIPIVKDDFNQAQKRKINLPVRNIIK
jgi:hypothetical protein